MRVAKTVELDAQTERELRVLSQRRRIEVRLQQRARIVLLAAKGMQNKDIAVEVGLDRRQVAGVRLSEPAPLDCRRAVAQQR